VEAIHQPPVYGMAALAERDNFPGAPLRSRWALPLGRSVMRRLQRFGRPVNTVNTGCMFSLFRRTCASPRKKRDPRLWWATAARVPRRRNRCGTTFLGATPSRTNEKPRRPWYGRPIGTVLVPACQISAHIRHRAPRPAAV